MPKKMFRILSAGMIISLVGCQSTTSVNTLFHPFPSSPSAPGMTLTQYVEDALRQSGDPYISQVHVTTTTMNNQNVVVLSGYVKKIRQSDTAEQIARKVPGVQNVQNSIIIRP